MTVDQYDDWTDHIICHHHTQRRVQFGGARIIIIIIGRVLFSMQNTILQTIL